MRSDVIRNIESGEQYDSFFPAATGKAITIKKGAYLSDTVKFIPKAIKFTLHQTKAITKQLVKEAGSTAIPVIAKRIWNFLYRHIPYKEDEKGFEEIRAPARAWADRKRGIDCDCYTVFISSILSNLKIPHLLRIAKYKKDYFQHIYPVAIDENGKEIVIDCVVESFNYEEPYTEIKDTIMDLQFLSGLDDNLGNFESSEVGDLGKVNILQKAGKVLNVVNKINPATALLRNGFLITMRTNLFNVAGRLKWAYIPEADAKKRGIDLSKWKKLVDVKNRLENLHYGAGGKKEDLKKAILTGNGNKNKEVSPLLGLSGEDVLINAPISQLLGEEIYASEKESLQGLGELGEPVTIAAVTAATGGVAAIAALIKAIGNIFPPKAKGAEDFNTGEADAQAAQAVQNTTSTTPSLPQTAAAVTSPVSSSSTSLPATSPAAPVFPTVSEGAALPPPVDNSGTNTQAKGFWEQNKTWLKPTLIGIGSLGILTALFKIFGQKRQPDPAIAGIRKRHLMRSRDYGNRKDGSIGSVSLD